jgi:hypothetical protein
VDTGGSYPCPGVKLLGRDPDHSHLVPNLRMRGAIPPLAHYMFIVWCLVRRMYKERENLFAFLYVFTADTYMYCIFIILLVRGYLAVSCACLLVPLTVYELRNPSSWDLFQRLCQWVVSRHPPPVNVTSIQTWKGVDLCHWMCDPDMLFESRNRSKSRDSSVGIASRTVLGPTQPPIQWVPGALSLGVKRPGREADDSPPSNAEVKNAWSYTSTPHYAFLAWCLTLPFSAFNFVRTDPIV